MAKYLRVSRNSDGSLTYMFLDSFESVLGDQQFLKDHAFKLQVNAYGSRTLYLDCLRKQTYIIFEVPDHFKTYSSVTHEDIPEAEVK